MTLAQAVQRFFSARRGSQPSCPSLVADLPEFFDSLHVDLKDPASASQDDLFSKFAAAYLLVHEGKEMVDLSQMYGGNDPVMGIDQSLLRRSLDLVHFIDIGRFYGTSDSGVLALRNDALPPLIQHGFEEKGPIIKTVTAMQEFYEVTLHNARTIAYGINLSPGVKPFSDASGQRFLLMPKVPYKTWREFIWDKPVDRDYKVVMDSSLVPWAMMIFEVMNHERYQVTPLSRFGRAYYQLDDQGFVRALESAPIFDAESYIVRKLLGTKDNHRLEQSGSVPALMESLIGLDAIISRLEREYFGQQGKEFFLDVLSPMSLKTKDLLLYPIAGDAFVIPTDAGDNLYRTSIFNSLGSMLSDPFYFFNMMKMGQDAQYAMHHSLLHLRFYLEEYMEKNGVEMEINSIDYTQPFDCLVYLRTMFNAAIEGFAYAARARPQGESPIEGNIHGEPITRLEVAYEYLLVFDHLSKQLIKKDFYHLGKEHEAIKDNLLAVRGSLASVLKNEFVEWQGRLRRHADPYAYSPRFASSTCR
jgi:hypothetical protein